MWKAYGLVYKLLAERHPGAAGRSRPRRRPPPTSTSPARASRTSARARRSGVGLPRRPVHHRQRLRLAGAADHHRPGGRRTGTSRTSTRRRPASRRRRHDPATAPRIANEAVNIGVTVGATTTRPASRTRTATRGRAPRRTSSPRRQIANGGLYLQGAGCAAAEYDIFVTPHNSGYSYSLSDPTDLGTKTYSQLDTFVHDGGGWTALCHSIL